MAKPRNPAAVALRILTDDGNPAYLYRDAPNGESLARVPVYWHCPDEAGAKAMARIFAGDYSASPRSRPREAVTVAEGAVGAESEIGLPLLEWCGLPPPRVANVAPYEPPPKRKTHEEMLASQGAEQPALCYA